MLFLPQILVDIFQKMVVKPSSPFLTPFNSKEDNLTLSTGSIRVFARIRPFLENEKINQVTNLSIDTNASRRLFTPKRGETSLSQEETPLIRNSSKNNVALSTIRREFIASNHTLSMPNGSIPNIIVAKRTGMKREFIYDAVFNSYSSQKDFYDKSVCHSIRNNIFSGLNTTIFVYGQKNSGKTFTMLGKRQSNIPDHLIDESDSYKHSDSGKVKTSISKGYFIHEDDGVIPRAIHDLFKAKQRQDSIENISIKMSVIEMHNDELNDLLVENKTTELKIRDVGDDGVLIEGLTHIEINSAKQARDMISRSFGRKHSMEKKINTRASCTHTICQFIVTVNEVPTQNKTTKQNGQLISKLTMVDLAASDCIHNSDLDQRESKRESININKDLFVLGKVLAAIADDTFASKVTHIPCRDSKLTMILSDSLRSKCVEIFCCLLELTNPQIRRKV
jgi:hypothetical protein